MDLFLKKKTLKALCRDLHWSDCAAAGELYTLTCCTTGFTALTHWESGVFYSTSIKLFVKVLNHQIVCWIEFLKTANKTEKLKSQNTIEAGMKTIFLHCQNSLQKPAQCTDCSILRG